MNKIIFYTLQSSIRSILRNEGLKFHVRTSQMRLLGVSTSWCTKLDSGSETSNKKKSKIIPRITLLQQDHALSVTTLEEAERLARRRSLQLIKIQDHDPKSQRPVYRLATDAELLAEDFGEYNPQKSSVQSKKSEKSLTIGSRISDNDLASRLKNITKWLNKGVEVRILIQGSNDDTKSSEKILQKIEEHIKEPMLVGKITQKRSKDNFIKFNIVPSPVNSNKESPKKTA